jgi:hypothetical protein
MRFTGSVFRRVLYGSCLKMGDEGAISAFLTGFTQVHVRKDKKVIPPLSSQIYKFMYLGF